MLREVSSARAGIISRRSSEQGERADLFDSGMLMACFHRVTSFPDIEYPSAGVSRIAQICISLTMNRTYDLTPGGRQLFLKRLPESF